jgi:hypothetical protein
MPAQCRKGDDHNSTKQKGGNAEYRDMEIRGKVRVL